MEKQEKLNKPYQKRARSENWQEEDKRLLTELVRERVYDIENKNTDTNSNSRKIAAWQDLQNCFNCTTRGSIRTITQLRSQWGQIKMAKKKQLDGPKKIDVKKEDITSWLPFEFVTDTNESDICQDKNDIQELGEELVNTEVEVEIHTPKVSKPTPRKHLPSKPSEKKQNDMAYYSARIAKNEIDCRKELHNIQMENEKQIARILEQKQKNLELKEMLILRKMEYYENKK